MLSGFSEISSSVVQAMLLGHFDRAAAELARVANPAPAVIDERFTDTDDWVT